MGCSNSKIQNNDAVGQCEQRKSFVKQAVQARSNLAQSHARYVQALSSTAIAFRQFAEGEFRGSSSSSSEGSMPSSSSSSASAAAVAASSSSDSSSASNPFSPKEHDEAVAAAAEDSPASPIAPIAKNVDQNRHRNIARGQTMRLWNTPSEPLRVVLSPPRGEEFFAEYGGAAHSTSPPETDWEYFNIFHPPAPVRRYRDIPAFDDDGEEEEEDIPALEDAEFYKEKKKQESEVHKVRFDVDVKEEEEEEENADGAAAVAAREEEESKGGEAREDRNEKEKEKEKENENEGENEGSLSSEGSDAASVEAADATQPGEAAGAVAGDESAKDLAAEASSSGSSSMELVEVLRELEEQFLRAAETGKPVLRMLEAQKVHNQLERGVSDHSSKFLTAISLGHWSPRALSSPRNGIENEESGGMSGSHAGTLDRLYAWEKKLFEEVKTWESMNTELERKRKILRNLDAKGAKPDAIDKTRASMKALETQISVALQAMEASSTAIQKITDEEMVPQLLELLHGLAEMWKGMHECHEQQLAVVMRLKIPQNMALEATSVSHKNTTGQLEAGLTAWHTTLGSFINSQKEYVGWLEQWIMKGSVQEPTSRARNKKHTPVPKIQHMCQKWKETLNNLPLTDVTNKIKEFAELVREIGTRQTEELRIQRRADALAKELNKKIISLKNMEKKYMEGKERQDGTPQLADKRSSVEALRSKVHDEKVKFNSAIQQTRAFTLSSLQTSLPPLFQALQTFAGACMTGHQNLYNDVNSHSAPV